MMMPGNSRFPSISQIVWLLLAGLSFLLQLGLLWSSLLNPYREWVILNSYAGAKPWMTLDSYALYVWVLRSIVTGIFWLGAVVTYREGRSLNIKDSWHVLIIALAMILSPIPFVLDGFNAQAAAISGILGAVLDVLQPFLGWIGVLLYLLLAYIIPDGYFRPRWMGWVCLILLTGLTMLFLLPVIDFDAEWLWFVTMLVLIAALFTGLASQIYRYRQMGVEDRNQARGIFIALMAQPLALLGSVLFGDSPWGGILSLHLQYVVLALLPISFLEAIMRRRLWALTTSTPRVRLIWIVGPALALAAGLITTYHLANQNAGLIQKYEPLPASANPMPVIIDTDMAPDDWMAILFMLQRRDVKVLAITVSGTGEVRCPVGATNVQGLVALAGENGIPAGCGRTTPLEGLHVFPDDWRDRADSMNGQDLPSSDTPLVHMDAVELLVATILDSEEKVSILTLGPLTNLAEAIQREPEITLKIENIVIMGGALQVPGNVGYSGIDNQVAEWNFFIDPLAVKIVLESGGTITLVSLDATNDVPIDIEFYRLLKANRRTPEAQFVFDLLTNQLDFIASGGYYFWDPLAAALLVDPSLGYIKEGQVKVFTAEGPSSGLTRLMPDGAAVRYTASAQAERFYQEFLRTLNQP